LRQDEWHKLFRRAVAAMLTRPLSRRMAIKRRWLAIMTRRLGSPATWGPVVPIHQPDRPYHYALVDAKCTRCGRKHREIVPLAIVQARRERKITRRMNIECDLCLQLRAGNEALRQYQAIRAKMEELCEPGQ
jgi:hypothetical protein